jgi:lysine 2,3-aminomutase
VGVDGWIEELGRVVRRASELDGHLRLSAEERRGIAAAERAGFPLLVTPSYLALMDPDDPMDPIRIQAIPSIREVEPLPLDLRDPLAEEVYTVAPHLIRRYPDRALLLATDRCATHCRHCTRRRRVGLSGLRHPEELDPAMHWLADNREVKEVLVSGGDPLVASDEWIDELLGRLRRIEHLELIRIGSRVPVTLPSRVTDELCEILRRWGPLYLTTHFNHPRELTDAARAACARLVDAGIPMANQTVLLRGVNDSVEVQEELGRALLRSRVRPYYLMQCDSVSGTGHLRVPTRRGIEIMAELRRRLTGLAIPSYVLDLPGGHGKILLAPTSIVGREGDLLVLSSPRGEEVRYFDRDDESSDA